MSWQGTPVLHIAQDAHHLRCLGRKLSIEVAGNASAQRCDMVCAIGSWERHAPSPRRAYASPSRTLPLTCGWRTASRVLSHAPHQRIPSDRTSAVSPSCRAATPGNGAKPDHPRGSASHSPPWLISHSHFERSDTVNRVRTPRWGAVPAVFSRWIRWLVEHSRRTRSVAGMCFAFVTGVRDPARQA